MSVWMITGAGGFLFVVYWWLLAKLVGAIFDAPRLKQWQWLLVGAVNVGILFFLTTLFANVFLSYIVMIVLMLVEWLLFFKEKFLTALLCTLACSLHIIAAFVMAFGLTAMTTGIVPHDMGNRHQMFWYIAILCFGVLDLAIVCVIKLVPLPMIKVINQHKEQQWFLIAWMLVNNGFLLYMAKMFNSARYPAELAGTQVSASLASMLGLYIVLFFSIKTIGILGYKEKNAMLEQAIQQEQQYRISMVKDALASYEINVTKNKIIAGFEDQREEAGNSVTHYSDMLIYMAHKRIYSDDVAVFAQNFSSENFLRLLKAGKSETEIEYRRRLDTGEYIWVRASINLVQDVENKDVKAFICVKDINVEKNKQLELQRKAERDPLTSLYNKSMTAKLVDEHLVFGQQLKNPALFMIDVDNFKEINDHLGHVYGDAVLCELSDKLARVFRVTDIIGRIGGDEYIVFLKDGANLEKVEQKAREICKAFQATYKGLDGKQYSISSSVGVALFPGDGVNFKELYANADVALYAAKSGGKNEYRFYDGSKFNGYTATETEIQTVNAVSQKGFRQNRIEYVFKMLYQSENSVAAIHSVLELTAKHFQFERGYIFETSKDGKSTCNTFEWCAEGVEPVIQNLQNLPISVVENAHASFQKCGTFMLRSLDELQPNERAVLSPQGVKSMFQFGMFDKSRLIGFIGFDNCNDEAELDNTEIDEMKTICNILSTFFVRQYIDDVAAKDLCARQDVMNNLDNFIYVINMETFEVLFMNEKIQRVMSENAQSALCYDFFRGKSEQCADCPVRQLGDNETARAVCELYNDKLDIWMKTIASPLRWTDGTLACLINCTDITSQKKAHQEHVQQLEQMLYVDELTGCRTYQKFKQDAQRILQQQPERAYFLAKMDINDFNMVNQVYGFKKGNKILCGVAEALQKTMRNENEIFARVGNDEFIALFGFESHDEFETIYQTFLQHFHDLVHESVNFRFNFPLGRYIIEAGGRNDIDIGAMYEKANIAHKQAKQNKTQEFVLYDEGMTIAALHGKEVENKMEAALQNGEFIVYMQPKYQLSNETIAGAEALARWQNPNKDLFYPSAFISTLERNGFITALDFYIFEKVCHIVQGWIAQGIEPVIVSANFSRLHLSNPNFVKKLCAIADGAGAPRKYLEIELTETVIYDNIETLEGLLEELHEQGFTMSMDDFGMGYSSLGMLKNLPVDVIKMDRSFFADQRDIGRSAIVVSSVIQMADGLGMGLVAEGVECQEHVDFLRELGCNMVQGYFFAKPMPEQQFTQLLRTQSTQQ